MTLVHLTHMRTHTHTRTPDKGVRDAGYPTPSHQCSLYLASLFPATTGNEQILMHILSHYYFNFFLTCLKEQSPR